MVACKTKQEIVPIQSMNLSFLNSNATYEKEVLEEVQKYEGKWLYQKDTTTLAIIFIKDTINDPDKKKGISILIGETIYIENGKQIFNTVHKPETGVQRNYHWLIKPQTIIDRENSPKCEDCSEDEKRVIGMLIFSYSKNLAYSLFLRYKIVDGQELMTVVFRRALFDYSLYRGHNHDPSIEIPYYPWPVGEYTFIKQ